MQIPSSQGINIVMASNFQLDKLIHYLVTRQFYHAEVQIVTYLSEVVNTFNARQLESTVINPRENLSFANSYNLAALFAYTFDTKYKERIPLHLNIPGDLAKNNNLRLLQCSRDPFLLHNVLLAAYELHVNLTEPFFVRFFTDDDYLELFNGVNSLRDRVGLHDG